MVGPSKILTVSYGTFSCTLEGFDDPFNTMKAIAEYFRDLAADDRYFGAEPPVPDAAMLHRIAEREVQRRVEARVQEGGVLLRAAAPGADAGPVSAPVQAPAAPPVAAAAPRLHAPSPSIEESVAAKLARIRAAVDRARVAPPAAADIEDAVEVPVAAAVVPAAATAFVPADAAAPDAAGPDDAATDRDVEGPAAGRDADGMAAAARDATPTEAPDAPEAPETVEVPAVEAATAEIDDAPDHVVEDAADATDAGAAVDAVAGAAAEAPAQAASADDTAVWDATADEDAALAAATGGLASAPAPVTTAEADPAAEPAGDPDLDALIGRIAAADAAPATEAHDTPGAAAAASAAPEAEHAAAPVAGPLDAPAAEAPAELPLPPVAPVRARVVKVRRVEPEVPPASILSPEEEDELARELAAVEREMTRGAAVSAPVAPPTDTAPTDFTDASGAVPAPLPPGTGDRAARPDARPDTRADTRAEDAAVSRLIAQTNTAMDGAENRRRAATIAHLKAAVAATVAERAAGTAPADAAKGREDAYREDLAEAVRPRRPEAVPGIGRRRPDTGARIAPLVLVSEQRIDRAAGSPADAIPVRPRRVTAGSLALTQALDSDPEAGLDDEGAEDRAEANITAPPGRFAELVEQLGAGQLPEVIEAAAAYITVIDGRETFTRPQLVRLAASVAGDAPAREDGLRAFGLLLREGRIVKARRGQFALAEGNRMLAEMRRFA